MKYLKTHKTSFVLYPGIYCLICAVLLLLPLKFLFAWVVSVFVHELSHYIAIRLTGGHIRTIKIKLSGIQMHTEPLKGYQELICAAAGPIGGLLLFWLGYKCIPMISVFSLIHALYNLIPLFPLDGGRVVRNLSALIFKNHSMDRFNIIFDSIVSFFLVAVVLLGMTRFSLGPVPLMIVLIMIFNNRKQNALEN